MSVSKEPCNGYEKACKHWMSGPAAAQSSTDLFDGYKAALLPPCSAVLHHLHPAQSLNFIPHIRTTVYSINPIEMVATTETKILITGASGYIGGT